MTMDWSRYTVTNTPLASFILLWFGLKHGKLINQKSSKKYKIKENLLFSVNTNYMSSRELKTSEFSLVLRSRENSDVFKTLDEIYLVFTSKKGNIFYI